MRGGTGCWVSEIRERRASTKREGRGLELGDKDQKIRRHPKPALPVPRAGFPAPLTKRPSNWENIVRLQARIKDLHLFSAERCHSAMKPNGHSKNEMAPFKTHLPSLSTHNPFGYAK